MKNLRTILQSIDVSTANKLHSEALGVLLERKELTKQDVVCSWFEVLCRHVERTTKALEPIKVEEVELVPNPLKQFEPK